MELFQDLICYNVDSATAPHSAWGLTRSFISPLRRDEPVDRGDCCAETGDESCHLRRSGRAVKPAESVGVRFGLSMTRLRNFALSPRQYLGSDLRRPRVKVRKFESVYAV